MADRNAVLRVAPGRRAWLLLWALLPGCYESFAASSDSRAADADARDAIDVVDTSLDDGAPDVPPPDTPDAADSVDAAEVPDSRTDAAYDAPTTCEYFEYGIVWDVDEGSYFDAGRVYAAGADPIMHMIAVYESSAGGRIVVHVGRTYRPVILVLSSYEAMIWEIRPEPGATIDRVLLYGYEPQEVESDVEFPVIRSDTRINACYRWPFCSGGTETQEVVWDAEAVTGVPLSTFSGAYHVGELWIRHYCREDCAAAVACSGRECGPNPGCLRDCGTCPAALSCIDNACVECDPVCAGRVCGPDGCDGTCGTCPSPLECSVEGACGEPVYFPSCASATEESHYCVTLVEGGMAVVGLDSGLLCRVGKEMDYLASASAAVDSISFIDGYVYVCGDRLGAGGLLRVDVRDGSWEIVPHLRCEAIAGWNGGLLIMPSPPILGAMMFYADWEHALAGDGEEIPARPFATRMTTNGDRLYSAWHSTDAVLVNELPSGVELPSILLEDYDDWIWGMAVTDDGWLIITNGRDNQIVVFDVETGARRETVTLHGGTGPWSHLGGLACFWNP